MTFSRRPGARFNRGRIATAVGSSAPPAVTPVTLYGANCIEWWRADLGNTIAVDGNWVGQVAGTVLTQAAGASRPTQSASGGPNSTAMMTFDGTDDWLRAVIARPAPGTTPHCMVAVISQTTWTGNDPFFADDAGTFSVIQRTASPQLAMSAGVIVNLNNGLAVAGNPWGRMRAEFQNSGALDTLQLIANRVGPAGAGNTAGTALRIGTNSGGLAFGAFRLAELFLLNVTAANVGEDAYITGRYGAGLV